MNSQSRMAKIQSSASEANRKFFSHYRELFVYFRRPDLDDSIVAFVRLHEKERLAKSEPSDELYMRILEEAFLTLFDRGAIKEIAELSNLAWDDLEAMRRNTGIGVGAMQAQAPAPQLSEEQKLEAEIRQDWKSLPTKKIREKVVSNPAYSAVFDKIASTLDSVGGLVTLR